MIWNNNVVIGPFLLYEDELVHDPYFPRGGLICRSGSDSLYPTWYHPSGKVVAEITSLGTMAELPGVGERIYQFRSYGTSRLVYNPAEQRGPTSYGIFACRLPGFTTVVAGVYRRWSFSGKVESVCMATVIIE